VPVEDRLTLARTGQFVDSPKARMEDEMPSGHSRINLADIADAAATNGFGDRWEAGAARVDLDAEQTGLTHFRLRPGKRSPFMHRHKRAEEVYVILGGTGRIKLDNEILDVRALDAVRVAPEVLGHSRRARTDLSSSPSAPIATPTVRPSKTSGSTEACRGCRIHRCVP
jgi:mannose-6-phosphate isomerase-like protein (cupin superfamily)